MPVEVRRFVTMLLSGWRYTPEEDPSTGSTLSADTLYRHAGYMDAHVDCKKVKWSYLSNDVMSAGSERQCNRTITAYADIHDDW